MHLLSRLIVLAVTGAATWAVPVTAQADTGGDRLYFQAPTARNSVFRPFSAPAEHPGRPTRLPLPDPGGPGGRRLISGVVPSPDERHVAMTLGAEGAYLYVTDADGKHARVAFRRLYHLEPGHRILWGIGGVAWRGSHRLYFSATRTYRAAGQPAEQTNIYTLRVGKHGVPGRPRKLSGTGGLSLDIMDPTAAQVASLRMSCTTESTTSTIIVMDLATGAQRDLITLTEPVGTHYCRPPIQNLAWSPDGTLIAFEGSLRPSETRKLSNEIDVVAADGSDGQTPRVAVPNDGEHWVRSPAWRSDRELWFTQGVKTVAYPEHQPTGVDFFSARLRDGRGVTRERESRTRVTEYSPSFG